MRVFHTIAAFLFLTLLSTSVQANVVFWEDSKHGVTLTYPDDWRRINSQKPDDILTIAAPSGDEQAFCKIRVRDNQKYMIYPPHLHPDVQKVAVNKVFWQNYIADFYNPVFEIYHDEAGLGRGYGSYALAEFTNDFTGGQMRRRGMFLASLYNGDVYIFECSAERLAYETWAPSFFSIARSVKFDKTINENYTGNYRDFLDGPNQPMYFRDIRRTIGRQE